MFWLLLVCVAPGRARAGGERRVALSNDLWTVTVVPDSLAVMAQPAGAEPTRLSGPQERIGPATALSHDHLSARWRLRDVDVSFALDGGSLSVRFVAEGPGRFTWPIVGADPSVRGWILPLSEGSYVPAEHAEWLRFLTEQGPLDTTEGLSMPFYGLDCGNRTFTCIATNPLGNELAFDGAGGRLGMRFRHEFLANWDTKESGFVIRLGPGSPIEPAWQYRRWLMERGEFVSLRQKAARVPGVEKLLGAAHVYLWGDALLSRHDVADWRSFAGRLLAAGDSDELTPARRLWELLGEEDRDAVRQCAAMQRPQTWITRQIAAAVSGVLERRDFYRPQSWRGVRVPPEAEALLERTPAALPQPALYRLNCFLLRASFPDALGPVERWGDGVSLKMMERLAEAGLDRLWVGLDSYQGGCRHPEAVARARELGYLIGPYDSYHSIHRPDEPDTWETAQFDLALYESGPIVRADGTKVAGFRGKGYALSPIAARPYVERRVSHIMDTLPAPFNSWFIDCDAYGQLYDDYSALHPATQLDGMKARLDRMAWIRDTYGLVIGSERGAAYAAAVIHFAHGMTTPVFGWGDPDLRRDKESAYYLGAWWPPDGPAVMVKQVPLKPRYYTFYFDPRFRLPLYQAALHDSLVTTHHWGAQSLKFSDQAETVALTELLYGVPPLYHLNLDEWGNHRDTITRHYAFFSPLHRELGELPLTEFGWLDDERLVQRTLFGEGLEVVANFGTEPFRHRGAQVPSRSVMATWLDSGRTEVFTPGAAE
ncbi:MAG: hypothetical protein AMK73_06850 [Planctomycetes bacterium SM23_32]|nr:MAG: hypothetical protein AMK73_06850 [Planctomycetes bacterium SM23_32]